MLNSLLPPAEWTQNGQQWAQYASSAPATRGAVLRLQELLDARLNSKQARERGICAVREELYEQCMNELIRQVTVDCVERGVLLLRIRDELRMTREAYRTLYESSVAFAMRKALESEAGKAEMDAVLEKKRAYRAKLEQQVRELKAKCSLLERRKQAERAKEEERLQGELKKAQDVNAGLEEQFSALTNPSRFSNATVGAKK